VYALIASHSLKEESREEVEDCSVTLHND
jgi:hypothetical protein